ncbi:MipA/OmpV family protein [Pseudomonas sp. dw_358]|uniref:MipA/OmpV family protein n=1 Tax=Pseudomonas sp. dw_358 TaxID=2720083 RepID=UPI001BD2CEE8|nr:MipA/OmpV family protein [Pseudomonas sp. dw_358]
MKFVQYFLLFISALAATAASAEGLSLDGLQGDAGAGLSWQAREPAGTRHDVQPMPYFDLQLGNFDLDSEDGLSYTLLKGHGISVGPFVNYVQGRTANGPLRGLRDVSDMGEGGAFISYSLQPWWELSAQVGHTAGSSSGQGGLIGKVAGELDYPVGGGLFGSTELTAHYADRRFEQTFFDVQPDQVQATGLGAYRASGGLQDITLSQGVKIPLGGHWSLLGDVSWVHLSGSAADSSLVKARGEVNQAEVMTAVAYHFD